MCWASEIERRKWRPPWAGHQKHKREENVGLHGLDIKNIREENVGLHGLDIKNIREKKMDPMGWASAT